MRSLDNGSLRHPNLAYGPSSTNPKANTNPHIGLLQMVAPNLEWQAIAWPSSRVCLVVLTQSNRITGCRLSSLCHCRHQNFQQSLDRNQETSLLQSIGAVYPAAVAAGYCVEVRAHDSIGRQGQPRQEWALDRIGRWGQPRQKRSLDTVSDVRGSHRTFRNERRIVLDVRGSHRTFRNGRKIVSDAGGSHNV
jgi:hypothetical protein